MHEGASEGQAKASDLASGSAAPQGLAGRRHITLDPADNVTTLLDDCVGLGCLAGGGPCSPGTPFGHKVALAAIPAGSAVVKYGAPIGLATRAIAPGEHVHVHNLR